MAVPERSVVVPGLETQVGDYSKAELLALIVTDSLVRTMVSFADTAESEEKRQYYGNLALSAVDSYETAFNRKI